MPQVKGKEKIPEPEDMAFGEKLRQWRQSLRLSQTELGAMWGNRSQSAISSYETGETPVERKELRGLAVALGKGFDEVLECWIDCQRGSLSSGDNRGWLSYILPSGIKVYAEDNGTPMEYSPEDLLKIDRLIQSIKASKQRS